MCCYWTISDISVQWKVRYRSCGQHNAIFIFNEYVTAHPKTTSGINKELLTITISEKKDRKMIFQFSSVAQSCPTLCDSMNCRMPGLPVHYQLPESIQTHVHWVSDAIQPSHPLSSPSPPALNLPSIRVFSNDSALHIRWSKYWSFSFNTNPSNKHPGLISFRMVWLNLLAVQGTLKSLLQHHSSKASVLWHSL